jgi:ubiquinone biosynthesis protein UbiJ
MEMTAPNAAESASEQIESLEKEITDFERMLAEHQTSITTLMDREDPQQGIVFPEEIFTLRQDVLRVRTEIQIRRNRINRLRQADEP